MIRSICLLIAVVGGSLAQVSAAPDDVVFRSDVSLVRVERLRLLVRQVVCRIAIDRCRIECGIKQRLRD